MLALTGATVCMLLAWWQWSRWESNSGTFQNLGYALQWPAFAVFCIYAYRKFVLLESQPESAPRPDRPTEIPEELLPPRPSAATLAGHDDPVLSEYNRYLSSLPGAEDTPQPHNRTSDGRRASADSPGADTPQDRTSA